MDEQKNNSFSFLASLGLAGVGAAIFIAAYFLVMVYSSLLNSESLLSVWMVMFVLVLGFLAVPMIVYYRTSVLKFALNIFVLEILWVLALGIITILFFPSLAFLPPFFWM